MGDLVDAGWLSRRCYRSVVRYTTPSLGEDALEWIRTRLSEDPDRRRAFDELEHEVTEIVLDRYGEALREVEEEEELVPEKEPITGEL